MTFEEIILKFKEYLIKKGSAGITVRSYLSDIRHFLAWFKDYAHKKNLIFYDDSSLLANHLSKKVIEEYKNTLMTGIIERIETKKQFSDVATVTHQTAEPRVMKTSVSSLNRRLSSLRKFFTFLASQNLIKENYAEKVANVSPQKGLHPAKGATLMQEFKAYLWEKNVSSLTIKNYLSDISQFINWLAGVTKEPFSLKFLTPYYINEYKNRLFHILAQSPRSINRKLSSLRVFVRFCQEKKGLKEDPFITQEMQEVEEIKEVKKKRLDLGGIFFNFLKTIFFPFVKPNTGWRDKWRITGIPKEFFAPISPKGLPWSKRLLYHLKYTRPKWYKKYHQWPLSNYLNFAILILFCTAIGFLLSQQLFGPKIPTQIAALPTVPPRYLSFQGRLTDEYDNPITTETSFIFKIFDALEEGNELWSESKNITPDQDGIFSTLLGDTNPIPDSVFRDYSAIWLEVTVDGETLSPRQRIATVAYALNAEYLQGYPASTSAVAKTIPVVDENGALTLAASSPMLQATSGNFKIKGQAMTIQSSMGQGEISITDGNSMIIRTATGSAGLIINQLSTGDLFSASASGVLKATINNAGALSLAGDINAQGTTGLTLSGNEADILFSGTGTHSISASSGTLSLGAFALTGNITGSGSPSITGLGQLTVDNLRLDGNTLDSTSGNLTLLSAAELYFDDSRTTAIPFSDASNTSLTSGSSIIGAINAAYGAAAGASVWTVGNQGVYPNNTSLNLYIGGTATSSAKFMVLGTTVGSLEAGTASTSGQLTLNRSGTNYINSLGGQALSLRTSVGGDAGLTDRLYISSAGNVGIGTTNPTALLDVNGKVAILTNLNNNNSGFEFGNGYDPLLSNYYNEGFTISSFLRNPSISAGVAINYLLRTEEFDNASWVKTNIGTVTANSVTAPNGALTAENIPAGTTSDANISQTITNSTTGYWTAGIWARAQSGTATIKLRIDSSAETGTEKEIFLDTKWRFYEVTQNFTLTHTTKTFIIITGTNDVSLWGAQLNPGQTANAYYTRTSSSLTTATPGVFFGSGLTIYGTTFSGSFSGNASSATYSTYSQYGSYGGYTLSDTTDKSNYWEYVGNMYLAYNSTYRYGWSWNVEFKLKELTNNTDKSYDQLEDVQLVTRGYMGTVADSTEFNNTVPSFSIEIANNNLGLTPEDVAMLVYSTSTSNKYLRIYVKLKNKNTHYTIVPINRYGASYSSTGGKTTSYCYFNYVNDQAVVSSLPTPAQGSVVYGTYSQNSNFWRIADNNIYNWNSANVGIGTTSPSSLFSVGSSSQFQVDSSGDMVKIKNLTYSWPTSHTTNGVLTNDGSGGLSWSTIGSSGITPNSLDFTEFQDTLDLDADLVLNQSTYTWTQNFDGTTTTGLTYNANSLTSGTGLYISSTATGLTGDLVKIEASGNNSGVTGNVLKVGLTGASATGTALNITTAGSSGFALRVNDDGTYTDSTPFVIDASGNVGIGTTAPSYLLTLQGSNSVAVQGEELITNDDDRTFDSNTGNWSGTNWTISGGVASHTAGAYYFEYSPFTPTSGKTYQIKATINTTTAGTIYAQIGGVAGSSVGQSTGTLTQHTWVITTTGTGKLRFVPDENWVGTIDDVTLKEITPSNAILVINNSDGSLGIETRSGGSSYYNTFVGIGAGRASYNTTSDEGKYNSALGYQALYSNTTGRYNSAVGYRALYSNTTGYDNSAVGTAALRFNTTGYNNSAVGMYALYSNTTGYDNSAVGMSALYSNTTGYDNSAVGMSALYSNTTGYRNSAIGHQALFSNTTGYSNSALGYQTLYYNTTGLQNSALGSQADWYVPSAISTATAVSGSGLSVGTYYYRVSFVLDGVETGLGTRKNVTTTSGNQQVNLSGIPTYSGPKNCTARKIYRTKVNVATDYYLVTTINDNSTTTYSDTTPDSDLSTLPDDPDSSIMLGYGAKAFTSNQMVIGTDDYYINDLYLGEGVYATNPHDITINATGGQGTNNPGASLILAGGKGTGSGAGGDIIFKTAPAGASGTSANSLSEVARITSTGNVGIGTTSPSYLLDVSGGTGIVGRFSGRVIGAEAVNSNEFVTLSQLQGGSGSLWLDGGDYLYPNSSFATSVMVPSGNIGIGVTGTSGYNLYVSGTANVSTSLTTPLIIGSSSLALRPASNSTTAIQLQNAGGTPILNIDTTNQRVGIGTTGPISTLHVNGDIRIGNNRIIGNSNEVIFTTSGVGLLHGYNGSGLSSQNTIRLFVTQVGDVGIGTTSPSYKLDIADSSTTRGINVTNTTASSYGVYAVGTSYGVYGSDGTTSGYLGYNDQYGLYTANNAYVGGTLGLNTVNSVSDNNKVLTVDSGVVKYIDTSSWDKDASNDVTTFLGLTDTPSSYSGAGGYFVKVNSGETGLEFATASSISPWTETTGVVHLNTSTNNVTIGSSSNVGKLGVVGDTDEVQLYVKGYSTQTNNLVEIRKSDNTLLLSLDNYGNLTASGTIQGGALTDGVASLSSGTLDLGTNTIYDGNLTGNWAFNSGNLSGIGNLTASGVLNVASINAFNLAGNITVNQDVDIIPAGTTGINDLGSSSYPWDNLYVNQVCLSGDCKTSWPSGGGENYWTIASGAIYPVNSTLDLFVGGTSTASAKFAFTNVLTGTPTLKFNQASAFDLVNSTINALDIESGLLSFDTQNSYLGVGTTTPGYKLDVSGTGRFTSTLNVDSTANPGLTIGNGTTGYLKLGGSTISDAAGNLTLDSDTAYVAIADYLLITGNKIYDSAAAQRINLGETTTFYNTTTTLSGTTTLTASSLATMTTASSVSWNTTSLTLGGSATIYGGSAASGTLTLVSTSNATKGNLQFFSSSNYITPTGNLVVAGNITASTTDTINGLSINSASITDAVDITLTGKLYLPDGTATSPALTFTNDTNSGLYRLDSDKIGLITGGTAAQGITIDSSGYVGIGTTEPNQKLHIAGTGTVRVLIDSNDAAGNMTLEMKQGSTNRVQIYYLNSNNTLNFLTFDSLSSDDIAFFPGGLEVIRFKEGGNVGIGTTSPDSRLHLVGGDLYVAPDSGYTFNNSSANEDLYVYGNLEVDGTTYLAALNASSLTLSGNLDMQNNLILNIGAAGTDFTAGGGLTLAGDLTISGNDLNFGGGAKIDNSVPNTLTFTEDYATFSAQKVTLTGDLTVMGNNIVFSGLSAAQITNSLNSLNIAVEYATFSGQKVFVNELYSAIIYDSANKFYFLDPAATGNSLVVAGSIGAGTTTPNAKIDSLSTTGEQLRLTYTTGSAFAGFTVGSGGDLTINLSGGQLYLENGDVFNIGGVNNLPYNALSNSGTSSHGLTSDNDLYVEGDVEVDGTLFLDGNLIAPSSGTVGFWQRGSGSLAPANITDSLNLGAVATSSALVHLGGTANENSWINNANFGIGTTSPDRKLDILDSTNPQLRLTQTDSTTYAEFQLNSSGYLILTTTGDKIALDGILSIATTDTSVSYSRIGSATSDHALSTANDLLITGSLEVNARSFFDESITLSQVATVSATLSSRGLTFTSEYATFSGQKTTVNELYETGSHPRVTRLYPEFAGATLVASGSASIGAMTSDKETHSNYYYNYYEWNSTETTPQVYEIWVKWKIPETFTSFKAGTDDALIVDISTEAASNTYSYADVYVYKDGSASYKSVLYKNSTSAGDWMTDQESNAVIKFDDGTGGSNSLGDLGFSAGDTIVIRIVLSSKSDYYVRLGAITIKWNESWK